MRKIVLTFGLIAGIICAGMLLISDPEKMMEMDGNAALTGYTTMVIALSTIFFGVKLYRDKHMNGDIKFGKAFLIGIYISLIASFIYAVGWEATLSMNDIPPMEFMKAYANGQMEAQIAEGVSAEAAQKSADEMLTSWSWYDNLIPRFLWTMLFEMFFVGLIISLICAAILKNKNVLPAKKVAAA